MERSRQTYVVFLASPSDVNKERDSAEEVIDLVNKSVANPVGWHIDLNRWEETPPAFGRAQATINPLVDECDLFIGLLWERWGQPTGEYSSGFEEEFERAKARRRLEGKPEIWLFFKHVDKSRLVDPGEHLRKVIEFKEAQMRLNEVKFGEVRSAKDWEKKLHLWLPKHLLGFAIRPQEEQRRRAVLSSSSVATRGDNTEGSFFPEIPAEFPPQISAVLRATESAISSGTLDIASSETGISEFQATRLFLFSETLVSRRHTGSVLGTHELNLLYNHRGELQPAAAEKTQILRSILGGEEDVCPGWFWFKGLDMDQVNGLLMKLAIEDSAEGVRIGALDLLAMLKTEIPGNDWSALPLLDESLWVRSSAFNYLSEIGDESAVDFLERIAADDIDPMVAADATDARFRLLLRLNPDRAFTEVLSSEAMFLMR